MSERVRAVIVGTGGIASHHAAALAELVDQVELVAVADVDLGRAESFAAQYGAPRAYPGLTAMLAAEGPDLVHVCTPPGFHAGQVVECLYAGAWVWCEKPVTVSLAELDRIEEAERATGRYCSVVFQWRFGSAAQHVKAMLDNGVVGRPLVAAGLTTWFRDDAYYEVPWRGRWDTEGGGPTMGHGIHCIDLAVWLLDGWREVRSRLGRLARSVQTEDVAVATIEFGRGALGTLVTSVVSPREETLLRIDCERATIELVHLYEYRNASWRVTPAPGCDDVAEEWGRLLVDRGSTHRGQLEHVLHAMVEGRRPLTSGLGARQTLEVVTAIYRSGLTGVPTTPADLVPSDPFYHHLHGGIPGWVAPVATLGTSM